MGQIIFNNTLVQFQGVLSGVEKSKIITVLNKVKGNLRIFLEMAIFIQDLRLLERIYIL